MKSCDKIEKLITLSDLEDLTIRQRDEVARHIEKCERCSRIASEMNRYFSTIQPLKERAPEHANDIELASSIIGMVSELKESKESQHGVKKLKIQSIYFRVAASVLLFIMAGYYVQQTIYVNEMELSLKLTYTSKNSNNLMMRSYNECLEYSEGFVKEQLITDKRYFELLQQLSTKYPFRSYRNIASSICLMSNEEFRNANLETKKRIVFEVLDSKLNKTH